MSCYILNDGAKKKITNVKPKYEEGIARGGNGDVGSVAGKNDWNPTDVGILNCLTGLMRVAPNNKNKSIDANIHLGRISNDAQKHEQKLNTSVAFFIDLKSIHEIDA